MEGLGFKVPHALSAQWLAKHIQYKHINFGQLCKRKLQTDRTADPLHGQLIRSLGQSAAREPEPSSGRDRWRRCGRGRAGRPQNPPPLPHLSTLPARFTLARHWVSREAPCHLLALAPSPIQQLCVPAPPTSRRSRQAARAVHNQPPCARTRPAAGAGPSSSAREASEVTSAGPTKREKWGPRLTHTVLLFSRRDGGACQPRRQCRVAYKLGCGGARGGQPGHGRGEAPLDAGLRGGCAGGYSAVLRSPASG